METQGKLMDQKPIIREFLLPALSVLFGIEMIRYFVSGMTWIMGDRFSIGAFQLGGIAVVVFGMALLASPLRRLYGNQKSLIITAVGLGVIRLLSQIQYGEPLFNLVTAAIGVAIFGMFITICLDNARHNGQVALSHFATGLLLGFLLDTTMNGLFSTYDTIYQNGILPLIVTVVLVLVELILIPGYKDNMNETPSNIGSLPWLAIGPFIFLEIIVFNNIARLAALSGLILPVAFTIVLAGQMIGLFLATWSASLEKVPHKVTILVASLSVIAATIFSEPNSATVTIVINLVGQLSIGVLIVNIIKSLGQHIPSRIYRTSTMVNGFAMIILAIFILAYYAVYQINLPYSNNILVIVTGSILSLCGLLSLRSYGGLITLKMSFIASLLSLVLLIAPIISLIGWHDVEAVGSDGDTVKVMTYNLHNGFNTKGELGLEALAAVIEESDADIVALQEVSRGWLISGSVDMLSWLSQRLDMPYVSGPTGGPLWGNAILSKYSIKSYVNYKLPPDDLCIMRGFTTATINMRGIDLHIIATHLHHIEDDSDIRQVQVPVILDYWDNAANTIILGDLNAQPDTREIKMFYQAGLLDTLIDQPDALTYNSADLYERIDYIWLSPDIELVESYVPLSQASDHIAVIASISR